MQLFKQPSQVNAALSSPLLVPDHTRLESAKGEAGLEMLMPPLPTDQFAGSGRSGRSGQRRSARLNGANLIPTRRRGANHTLTWREKSRVNPHKRRQSTIPNLRYVNHKKIERNQLINILCVLLY